jgi:hypothetical protein
MRQHWQVKTEEECYSRWTNLLEVVEMREPKVPLRNKKWAWMVAKGERMKGVMSLDRDTWTRIFKNFLDKAEKFKLCP